jgi:hypothetical protein
MNWIRKFFVFIGLLIVFSFAFSANEVSISNVPVEKNKTSLSVEKIHSSAFIEPQASNPLTFSQKNPDFSFSKYLENYLVSIPNLKTGISFAFFANQDINRCEMVSLLLFPFHIFW